MREPGRKRKTMRIGEVTKERAEGLADQLLGTRKLIKKDEYGYYFQSGHIRMRVSTWHIKGNKKVFQTFFLAGKWYEGEVLEVFMWIGDYYSREMFFTPHTMEEIYYEYRRNEN